MDINEFFNNETSRKHNADALVAPAKFKDWQTNNAVLEEYFKWIREESRCASLKLDIAAPLEEVTAELESKAHIIAIHHREGNSQGWKVITLHGLSSIMTDNISYYEETGIVTGPVDYNWTDVSKFFPVTVEWIKCHVPLAKYSRARIMLLEPHGYIMPHKDYTGQMLGGGLNIAITNPNGVQFGLSDGGLVPWQPGDFRMIDIARYHSVRNNSDKVRIHMIISPPVFDWDLSAKRIVCQSYTNYKGISND